MRNKQGQSFCDLLSIRQREIPTYIAYSKNSPLLLLSFLRPEISLSFSAKKKPWNEALHLHKSTPYLFRPTNSCLPSLFPPGEHTPLFRAWRPLQPSEILEINANGDAFWTGKASGTDCPHASTTLCPAGVKTVVDINAVSGYASVVCIPAPSLNLTNPPHMLLIILSSKKKQKNMTQKPQAWYPTKLLI